MGGLTDVFCEVRPLWGYDMIAQCPIQGPPLALSGAFSLVQPDCRCCEREFPIELRLTSPPECSRRATVQPVYFRHPEKTDLEGRHIKAQYFSIGWLQKKREPREPGSGEGMADEPARLPFLVPLRANCLPPSCADDKILRALRASVVKSNRRWQLATDNGFVRPSR